VAAFPYAAGGCPSALPMPTAPKFEILHERVRELFLRCFTDGNFDPARRPDAQAWQLALLEAENSLAACPVNDQHFYGSHLSACPWCERRRFLGGVDSFPSREAVKQGWHLRGSFHRHRPALPVLRPRLAELASAPVPTREWPSWIWYIALIIDLLFFIYYFWSQSR
jgi:DNA-binding helix-hairpin-helix protein with protein kinase domain